MVADRSETLASPTRTGKFRRRWSHFGPAQLFVPALLALLAGAEPGRAQPATGEDAGPEWIRPEEVPTRADALLRHLEAAGPDAEAESSVAQIEKSLPQAERDLNATLERATQAVKRDALPAELEDIRSEILDVTAPLGDWKDELAAEARRVTEALDEIEKGENVWLRTRARPETAAAGEVVARRVASSIEALRAAVVRLRKWRARVIAASDRVIDRIAAADAVLEKLQSATVRERRSLLVPDRPPLWSRGLGAAIRKDLPRVPEEMRAYAQHTMAYVQRDLRPLVVQLLLAGFLMLALKRFSARALKRLAGDAAATRAARLLQRPYSIGLLLALIATPAFHPLAPRRFTQLVAVMALFPAARIVTHVSERASLTAFVGLFVLLLLDRVGLAVQPLPALGRATFLLTLAVGFGLAFWVSRRVQRDSDAPWLRRAAKLAMWGLALALLADVGGWTYLSALLGRGILTSGIAALYLYAAAIALAAIVAYGLASRTVRRSHLLGRDAAVLQQRAERILRWLGVGLWLYLMTTALGFRNTAAGTLSKILSAGVSVGALSLSVGGVLGFVLTLLAALLLARIVTRVLEEDVYPRTHLPRGVPYALSTLVRYGFYSLGFLFALAAAGVQLSQVSIMLGGFGIGIGLGLQDLVKNFAAGLTLLLERRVHVGDTLEVPSQGILGRVLSIGTRAAVVRSWNGAEVVVPNADLISSAVTNWTLSDRLYRLEVPVGVAYGTDPDRVVALLLDAVRSNEHLLAEPAPQALFKGFGDSSLDFLVRAWTDQGYDQAMPLTSQLGLAVHRTLREAGIVIPFPQRDLHLVSVSPAVREPLSGVKQPD